MNELQIFKNEEFGQVRWTKIDGKDYAVAKDIANALGYKNTNDAIIRHCKGVVKHEGFKINGIQVALIPEGDIYRLTAKSELSGAEKFESWIFDDILPTIRKAGGYVNNDDAFIRTYLPFADDTTKAMFKSTLETVRKQNELIVKQQEEINHKEDVIIGLVDKVTLAEKRQILNRVVRYKGANFQERWRELYRQFEMKYHIDLNKRFEAYNITHKPKIKNKVDYIDKIMNKIPELYEIACKLYESDVKELAAQIYQLN
ncbi:BRO-N domain-containing protein [Clostridium beijerinckii]|uniref:Transporter n=1 Tax=Clostridium beijerinckii TaxID=1520 RepID=A0A7X9SMV6_CLOBE|nr:BRO family protein [Clostridium beijerinckii]NMF04528.1 transporter [Clostridium beijerinckii]